MSNNGYVVGCDLSPLSTAIPPKFVHGLQTLDLYPVCIDVKNDVMVLGMNCGLVYIFFMKTGVLQRIRTEVSIPNS